MGGPPRAKYLHTGGVCGSVDTDYGRAVAAAL